MSDNERKRIAAMINSMMPMRDDVIRDMATDLYYYNFVFIRINIDGTFERINPERVLIQDEGESDV